MFKISTKGDYGLLLLATLAEKQSEGFISLKQIAKEKNLSMQYLSQIIIPLKEAGLVESREGLHGGYLLAKQPEHISLIEILNILEGDVAPVRCCNSAEIGKCGSEPYCGVKTIWHDAQNLISRFLRNKTLADVIKPRVTNVEIF